MDPFFAALLLVRIPLPTGEGANLRASAGRPMGARFRGGIKKGWMGRSSARRAGGGEVVLSSPLGEVAALDGGGHEGGELVGRAGEAGDAEGGKRSGVVAVVGR